MDLSQTTGRPFRQFGPPHSSLSHACWIIDLTFPFNHPPPKQPQEKNKTTKPPKNKNTHCLEQYSGVELRKQKGGKTGKSSNSNPS